MATEEKTDEKPEEKPANPPELNLPDLETFIVEIHRYVKQKTKQRNLPADMDVDARGSSTRIAITIRTSGEPGIRNFRRYDPL